ncbi:MAG TPA: protein kinase family protein [Mycobacterium sp.]|nr:protein kinase family protein [Mycobacterium sp.]
MITDRGGTSDNPFTDGRYVPGVCMGRYRLLLPHGGRPQLQFWQGFDMASGQEVALTLVDPDEALPEEFVNAILARTVRLKGIDMPGIARVREVVHTGRMGVVVSEWIRGGGLAEIADTAPSPTGVASAMQSLAAATEAAHRAGLMLSIDHPSRLRISVDGHAALAFPATMPETTMQSDLRGIGSAMCALLKVDEQQAGANDPTIPFLISTTVSGLLQQSGGIASAATLVTLLREASVGAVEDCRAMPPLPPPPSGHYAAFRNYGADEQAAEARRQIMRVGLMTAAVIAIVALVALGSTLNRFLGDDHDAAGLNTDKLGLVAPTSSPIQPPQVLQKGAAPGERVQPVAAAVFSPGGSPDSPDAAGAAIDGNPATSWSTDTYYDADPFPKFKPGVGLLMQLERPAALSAVTVELNSTGTVVQLRAAANNEPKTLADTTELSPPMPMEPGRNRIPVDKPAPVSNVVVWISTLGSSDGKSRAAISEIELQAASPPA